jgi:hypothetical protein
MEIYKVFVLIFGSWIVICSFINRLRLPNFLCLDRIFGGFLSTIVKLLTFLLVIYIIGNEIWKLYTSYSNQKEGLAPGTIKKPLVSVANIPGQATKTPASAINTPGKSTTVPELNKTSSPGSVINSETDLKKVFPDIMDIQMDNSNNLLIPEGYYRVFVRNDDTVFKMRPVPDNCTLKMDPSSMPKGSNVNPRTRGITPIVPSGNFKKDAELCPNTIDLNDVSNNFLNEYTYDANNLGLYSSINPELSGQVKESEQKVFDPNLKLLDPYPVYYEPGSFPFASTGYLPNYEDSVYISQSTNLSQVAKITNAPYLQGGFCKQYAKDDQTRNAKCTSLTSETCASTECCVLVGGTKCVAGDSGGPTIKSVFSDVTIPNRDYWYYQGKCVGRCP